MALSDHDHKSLFAIGNIILEKEMNFQISSQKSMYLLETELFDLEKEILEKKYSLNKAQTYIDNQEKDLKKEILNSKTNLGSQLLDIQSEVEMAQNTYEILDKKILDMTELKQLYSLSLEKLKEKILELQEIEITKNQYMIHLEQANGDVSNKEDLDNAIEKIKQKIQVFLNRIRETNEQINETKLRNKKVTEEIDNIQSKKQSYTNNIMKLQNRIEKQNKIEIKQNNETNGLSAYNDEIEKLRMSQIIHLSNVSKLYSKKLVIDSQISNIKQQIQAYLATPNIFSMNPKLDQYRNENFIKINREFLERAELINGDSQNLYTSIKNDIIFTRKKKKSILKKLAIAKDQLSQSNQNEINITNNLNSLNKKIKETVKSTEKIGKLLNYLDEFSIGNPTSFPFSKKELDKIRKSSYNLAQIHINNETELINQIKKYKNESKQLKYQISKETIKNENLRKKFEEMQVMKS